MSGNRFHQICRVPKKTKNVADSNLGIKMSEFHIPRKRLITLIKNTLKIVFIQLCLIANEFSYILTEK